METPDLSTLSDNIDSTDDLVPSLQVFIKSLYIKVVTETVSNITLLFLVILFPAE